MSTDLAAIANEFIKLGQWLDNRGWVPATGGNFSYRLNDTEIAITVSGKHKGELKPDDFMRVDYDGKPIDAKKPSDETLLHTGLYKLRPDVHAILHTHPRASVIATLLYKTAHIDLSGCELLKIFPEAKKTHDTTISLPIFDNSQDMSALQKEIDAWYAAHPNTPPVYFVRGHGLTVGADTIGKARYATEATEELIAYELAKNSLGKVA